MEENEMEEWEIVEYYSIRDDNEKRSKLGWILDTGMSLGKKAIITGVVVSSIPVLVPPLVIISALGCALSIPFGFVFASYACTDKLMSKLLPAPSPPLEYDYHEDEEQEEQDAANFEMYDHKQEEKEEEQEQMDAVKEDVEMRIELMEGINGNDELLLIDGEPGRKQQVISESEEKKNTTNDKYVEAAPELRNTEEDRKSGGREDVNLEVPTDTVATVKGAPPPDKGKSSKGKNIHYSKDTERRGKRKTSSALKFPKKKKDLDGGDKKQHDVKDMGGLGQSVKDDDVAHDVCVEMNDESKTGSSVDVVVSDVVANGGGGVDKKVELRSVTIYNEPAAGEKYNQAKILPKPDDGELKHVKEELPEEVKEEKVASAEDIGGHSDEGLFGEDEKIWKKMEAIRAIVGYKGPRSDSYMDELKALYLFTGIEPPSDSADFQNKLWSLMSVIGLK
ncbi:hypothetical protein PHJA_001148200 [Phtheirospermum japonicum]|uniref:Uncharacterized protein n=1 Tax=Phtheirospermum japonicum TaxID=374723 RepID=A0A830C0Z7_9LAMI|nr:hypothetical protein PHJA_001148200 [Phtheirospermum japonicum]